MTTATPTILHGPADADAFRIQVGRYKDRWYHDPLPACDLAPATDESWPSASIVKNAWPKFLTTWAAGEAATCAFDEQGTWRSMKRDAAIAYIAKAHDRSRNAAAKRGTATHRFLECLILGQPLDPLSLGEVEQWIAAAQRFVDECQPKLVISEAVAISRALGVGGTLDAVLDIDGKRYLVDYKTRALDKEGKGKHAANDDEAAQAGLYAQPDSYVIVDNGGRPQRMAMPELDGALIVSIAPDGYRIYPINLDKAIPLAQTLKAFWLAMGDSPVGNPVYLATAAARVPSPDPANGGATVEAVAQPPALLVGQVGPPTRDTIAARVKALDNIPGAIGTLGRLLKQFDVPRLGECPDDRLEEWHECLRAAEKRHEAPFMPAELEPFAVQPDPFRGLPTSDGGHNVTSTQGNATGAASGPRPSAEASGAGPAPYVKPADPATEGDKAPLASPSRPHLGCIRKGQQWCEVCKTPWADCKFKPSSAPAAGERAEDVEPPTPAAPSSALHARYDALPADLRLAVDAARAGTALEGVNIASRCTAEQAVVAAELIEKAEAEHETRKGYIASLLQGLDDEMVECLRRAATEVDLESAVAS